MWSLEPEEHFVRRFERYRKKHPGEAEAVLNNLDTYLTLLNSGLHPNQVRVGFIHQERYHGLIAIDQKGASPKPRQTRLYVFADVGAQVIHLVTVGDKNSQKQDHAYCRKYIDTLRKA